MAGYDYILEDIRGLCNYVLDYCDMQSGCQTCKLQDLSLGASQGNKCPIHIISMLDNDLADMGVGIRTK